MNRDEAKAILQIWRETEDTADIPGLSEALSLLESDPSLKAWLEAEREFDQNVMDAVSGSSVPADLRDRILSSVKPHVSDSDSPKKPRQRKSIINFPRALPFAASFVILFFVGLLLFNPSAVEAEPNFDAFCNQISETMQSGPQPQVESSSMEDILNHLREVQAPAPDKIPSLINSLQPFGADRMEWRGLVLGIVHMQDEGNTRYRLFIVLANSFPEPDELPIQPSFRTVNGMDLLVWRETDHFFAMASKDSPSALDQFLVE